MIKPVPLSVYSQHFMTLIDIAQNGYCSRDIYLQSSWKHRSVILQVKRKLNRSHWWNSARSL